MTRRRSLDSSSSWAWSCAGVCPARAARTQESSCRHCQAAAKSAGSPAAAGSARMREVQIGAPADSRPRSSRSRRAAGAISCRSLSSSRRRCHCSRSWRESASANRLPQRRRGRGLGADPEPLVEAADRAGDVRKQDLVAGPGADIGEAAERVRVRHGGAADPRGGQVGAQLRPRPRPAQAPAPDPPGARPRTSSGTAAPRSGPPTRASWFRQLVSIRRRRSSSVTA